MSLVPSTPNPGAIERRFLDNMAKGRKNLVIYLTGGLPGWQQHVQAAADAGADLIEIGIPFSDPVMDGPVIQESSDRALANGATPVSVLDEAAALDAGCPLAIMTYYNLVYRFGLERFAHTAKQNGISGVILPDLPLEEAGDWCNAADAAGIETIMLAAPTGSDERLTRVAERARGFVYGVGLLGITGERDALAKSALEIATRLKAVTEKPALVGVGISNPEQAVETCRVADGVIVGSAIVRRTIEIGTPESVGELVAEFRAALDAES